MWTAKLITSKNQKDKTIPVYWNLKNDKGGLRVTISVYKEDKTYLDAAKKQVSELLEKLNS